MLVAPDICASQYQAGFLFQCLDMFQVIEKWFHYLFSRRWLLESQNLGRGLCRMVYA
jgi:hypothetical protein